MDKSEYYILTITKVNKEAQEKLEAMFGDLGNRLIGDKFNVIIPNRKALSQLYRLMSVETYRVDSITALNDTKSFAEFKKELTQGGDNKPNGLHFGDSK